MAILSTHSGPQDPTLEDGPVTASVGQMLGFSESCYKVFDAAEQPQMLSGHPQLSPWQMTPSRPQGLCHGDIYLQST